MALMDKDIEQPKVLNDIPSHLGTYQMAKENIQATELTAVTNSQNATAVLEKRFTALNGFDAALRKGAIILMFSDSLKEEDRMRGTVKFKSQFFWGIDAERNKLVKVSRTALTGGMGYKQLPQPGKWELNEDKTWHILKPQENDPALETRTQWGISRLLPGAFEYEKGKISIPKAFLIEVTTIDYLCSRNPVDASASSGFVSKELRDCNFKEDSARLWSGNAYYPTKDQVADIIAKYNATHSVVFDDDLIKILLK